MAELALKAMMVAEFLEFDDGTDTRYELIGGAPVAMSPPKGLHIEITTRLVVILARLLIPPCRPLVGGGVAHGLRDTSFRLPDVLVTCSPTPGDGLFDQPRLIIEILSPSTEKDDRTTKLDFYKTFSSLQAILFVWQDTRRVELHERGANAWIVTDLIANGSIRLQDLALDLGMDEIYAA